MAKELEELFAVSASRPYEWDEFYVYRHPRERRKYIVASDAGCSCNYYEAPTLAEAEAEMPIGKREVYAAFSAWWDSSDSYERPTGTKIDNLERLRNSL